MSTIAYAKLTTAREAAAPGTSEAQTGLKTYIDALAGLVPAEVLSLHALIMSYVNQVSTDSKILQDSHDTARASFWGLVALSVILYVGARLINKQWDNWDYIRVLIPPLAFTGWTMLQQNTAFDAVCPLTELANVARIVIALFLGAVLGLVAAALAYKADQKPVPQP